MPPLPSTIARLEPVFHWYLRISRWLLATVAGVMFCGMLLANGYNIFMRSVTGQGTVWHQEVSIMAAFWIYFAAYALLSKDRGYITIDFLFHRLPARAAGVLHALTVILTMLFQGYLALLAVEVLESAGFLTTPVLNWSERIYVLPLLVGAVDIAVTELIFLLCLWARIEPGFGRGRGYGGTA